MAQHKIVTTDAEIEKALERAKLHNHDPLAKNVEHIQDLNLLIVGLSNHRRLVLPIEDIQGLGEATHAQIQNYELLGQGTGISFPDLDVYLYVPALIEGVYGNRRWMARLGKRAVGPRVRRSAWPLRRMGLRVEGRGKRWRKLSFQGNENAAEYVS